jgi:hypothetical protein
MSDPVAAFHVRELTLSILPDSNEPAALPVEACTFCSSCSSCSFCSGCSPCSGCSGCTGCSGSRAEVEEPASTACGIEDLRADLDRRLAEASNSTCASFVVRELMVSLLPEHDAGTPRVNPIVGCTGCTACTGCSACSGCTGCSACSNCSGCTTCSGSRYEAPDQRPAALDLAELRRELDAAMAAGVAA